MEHPKRNIAILGSTGSIGCQTLDLIEYYPEHFQIEVITANKNADLLINQAKKFKPNIVVIADDSNYLKVKNILEPEGIKVFAGEESISQIVELDSIDLVVNALVGYSGFKPTIQAIKKGKSIALANKETLVIGGELITQMAKDNNVRILPVDSEHSAIFQCLVGEYNNPVEKIYLTASGGPFRGKDKEFLFTVTKEKALIHPNWKMGRKITIDSATLMNKGLEVIEAKWLFGLECDQIEVIIHPQSIIHSIVQFYDGSMKAQMSLPDMRGPILYALFYPNRIKSQLPRFDFLNYPNLTFEPPDLKNFRNLALAYEALKRGGNIPCALNAANEIVVDAFLNDRIGFLEMSDIVEKSIDNIPYIKTPCYEDYISTDKEIRIRTKTYIRN